MKTSRVSNFSLIMSSQRSEVNALKALQPLSGSEITTSLQSETRQYANLDISKLWLLTVEYTFGDSGYYLGELNLIHYYSYGGNTYYLNYPVPVHVAQKGDGKISVKYELFLYSDSGKDFIKAVAIGNGIGTFNWELTNFNSLI